MSNLNVENAASMLELIKARYTCEEQEDGTFDLTLLSMRPDKGIEFLNGLDIDTALEAMDYFEKSELDFWKAIDQGLFIVEREDCEVVEEDDEMMVDEMDADDLTHWDDDEDYLPEYDNEAHNLDSLGAHELMEKEFQTILNGGSISVGKW